MGRFLIPRVVFGLAHGGELSIPKANYNMRGYRPGLKLPPRVLCCSLFPLRLSEFSLDVMPS